MGSSIFISMDLLPEIAFWILLIFAGTYAGLFIAFILCWIAMENKITRNEYPSTRITVIVVARNEEATIDRCLQSIARQDYPKNLFEIIIADDFSEDNTREKIHFFIKSNLTLKICLIHADEEEKDKVSKKYYIERAVSLATGELIITTDADCMCPDKWLNTIAGFYEREKPAMIISPVCVSYNTSFIEKFQALEFCGIILATGATAFMNKPIMCNGANLAFTREIFFRVNGYLGNEHIASGDDIFLMNKIKLEGAEKIKFLKSLSASVLTKPVTNFGEFIQQRLRWTSKAAHNPNLFSNGIGFLVFMSYFLPILFLGLSLVEPIFFCYFTLLVVVKSLVDFFYLYVGTSFFGKRNLLWIFPFALLFQALYVNIVIVKYLLPGSYSWKSRKIKK